MTEKQYRLNKWGTRLLKNNRPLFDWTNEPDEIVDLLNKLNDKNGQLKHRIKKLQNDLDIYSEIFTELNGLVDENENLKSRVDDLKELNKIYVDFLVNEGYELADVMGKCDVE